MTHGPRDYLTDHEISALRTAFDQGRPVSEVAAKMGRDRCTVYRWFEFFRSGSVRSHTHIAHPVRPEPRALEERDARLAALDLRDLTASLFGDPAPGWRALDKKNPGEKLTAP